MPRVYRSMLENAGQPKIERSANALGVRIEGESVDVNVQANGFVKAGDKGMSVAPLPGFLPRFRVYSGLKHIVEGAKSPNANLRIWRMGVGPFQREIAAPDLMLIPDPPKEGVVKHGVMAPGHDMPITAYETALANTQAQWVIDEAGP